MEHTRHASGSLVSKQRDSSQTFYYLDPPYPDCCQQHYKGYDTNDFQELLELLETIEGKFLLSNYMSPMLDRFIKANKLLRFIDKISLCCDEIRVSNIIPKDSFSVNPVNREDNDLILPDEEYIDLFNDVIEYYSLQGYAIFENPKTLGFVRYLLIPAVKPIIINWNIGSTVSKQVCENDIEKRQVNTFKCLVNGEISLSWNTDNIIKL